MNLGKKIKAAALTSLFLALMVPGTAFAREKITDLNLTFFADLDTSDDWPDMEITTDDEGYTIENFEFDTDSTAKYPEGTVYLMADDDYYFDTIKKSHCRLEGEGAAFVKAVKTSSTEMKLTVFFKSIGDEEIEAPQNPTWGTHGDGSWEPVDMAKCYQARLVRDGRPVNTTAIETTDTTCDFTSLITRPGTYTFKVRAVNRFNAASYSDWAESRKFTIDEATLAALKGTGSAGGSETPAAPGQSAAADSASSAGQPNTPGQWSNENDTWYWKTPDGTNAQLQWIYVDGSWYYVGADGQMATGWNWISSADGILRCYYFNPVSDGTQGRMYASGSTPDGYSVDGNGAWTVNGVVQTQ